MLRDLLAGHDSDTRYNTPELRGRIASIYLPLLSIVMDNYHHLYQGADGWDDLTATFERNTEVRRSVVIREGVDGGGFDVERVGEKGDHIEQLLGPVSTRNLLICFTWVLKNIDKELVSHWWATLSITRLALLLNVLDLCVQCFEYKVSCVVRRRLFKFGSLFVVVLLHTGRCYGAEIFCSSLDGLLHDKCIIIRVL